MKDESEIEARPLTREAFHELMRKLRARVESDAATAAADDETRKALEEKARTDRIEELRRQAAELEKEGS